LPLSIAKRGFENSYFQLLRKISQKPWRGQLCAVRTTATTATTRLEALGGIVLSFVALGDIGVLLSLLP
jgi:hypothetical protein